MNSMSSKDIFFSFFGVNNSQEFTALLIISFIFTWVLGLSVPILIRFVAKKPIPKLWAVVICGVWWFILVSAAILLGSRSNHHGALSLVALVSYFILRKGAKGAFDKKPKKTAVNKLAGSEKEKASFVTIPEISPTDKTSRDGPRKSIATNITEAELKRAIYAHLLKEKKDEATMLQAKVEGDGDTEKAETRYYQLRYQQIIDSGKINEIKERLLLEKRNKDLDLKEIKQKEREKSREANGVVVNRGLEWIVGPDEDTTWDQAKSWAAELQMDGGGWRTPNLDELESLYEQGVGERNMVSSIKTTGWYVWSEKLKGSSNAWYFDFLDGSKIWVKRSDDYKSRAFAVRSRGDG